MITCSIKSREGRKRRGDKEQMQGSDNTKTAQLNPSKLFQI